jgi:hypothetical protein
LNAIADAAIAVRANAVFDGGRAGRGCAPDAGGCAGWDRGVREAGGQDAVVQPGRDHGCVQAGAGDAVAVGGGDLAEELVAAQSPQIVGDLPGRDGRETAKLGG